MNSRKRIPQPFVVMYTYNEDNAQSITDWCRENITSYFYAFAASGPLVELNLPDPGKYSWGVERHENMVIFMFECPRDALLFKLTWGGE